MVQEIQRVLQHRREREVVLRHHEHKRARGADRGAPVARVLMDVLAGGRMCGLVKERQIHLGQIDHHNIEFAVRDRVLGEPLAHLWPHPARPGAGDDHVQIC